VPDDLRYSEDHEWVKVEDGKVRFGITDYAQDALGDVVFVQVPSVGAVVTRGASIPADAGEVDSLLDAAAYRALTEG
jgi:glycine cleavage system H protein